MKITLMKKLSLVIVCAILTAIVITSILSNFAVNRNFKKYLIDEQSTKINNVLTMINQLYNSQSDIAKINTDEIQRYAELQELYIEIRNSDNKILYSSGDSYLKHQSMMGNMMGNTMNNFSGMNISDYTENKYSLIIANKSSGTIIIGYYGSSFLSSNSLTFLAALNHAFVLSAAIAAIFGFIISIIISKQISKPLVKVTKTSNEISSGNLSARSSIRSNTKEIMALSDSINHLGETLQDQDMLRKKLSSDMAHELRTPLTTLKTHVEAFMDGVWEPTNERFQIFYDEIDRLTKMINNLYSLSKLEQAGSNLNKSKFNISEELEKIIDTFEPLYMKENYTIVSKIAPNISIFMDKDHFKQIMNNLLSNSFKYLNPNGYAEISLLEENKNIVIKVRDNGIGIPKNDLPFIFERFYRSDLSRSKDTGGSGIGLTLVKAFVEANGGKIYASSELGKYTKFKIEFYQNHMLTRN